MKKILMILIISIYLMSCEKSINKEQLESRNGVYYEVNKEVPYTGKVVNYYKNGGIEFKERYKNGRPNKEQIIYFENGEIKYKGNYNNGLRDGEWIIYYENGKIKYEGNYNNGLKNGEWVTYYENGEMEFKEHYMDGWMGPELLILEMDKFIQKKVIKMA